MPPTKGKPTTLYAFRMRLYQDDVDPQEVGETIEQLIADKQEHVTHEELIAAGRHASSPLHKCFTYDEGDAADKWRKREANTLVKVLAVAKPDSKGLLKATKTRAFVYVHHPEHEGKRVIMTTRSAMANSDFREQVIEQAARYLQRSLTYWAHAYGGNPELRALAKDVDRLRKRAEAAIMATV